MLGAPLVCPCKQYSGNCITGVATAPDFFDEKNPSKQIPAVFTQVSAVKHWIQTTLDIKDEDTIFVRTSGTVCIWKHSMSIMLLEIYILLQF